MGVGGGAERGKSHSQISVNPIVWSSGRGTDGLDVSFLLLIPTDVLHCPHFKHFMCQERKMLMTQMDLPWSITLAFGRQTFYSLHRLYHKRASAYI